MPALVLALARESVRALGWALGPEWALASGHARGRMRPVQAQPQWLAWELMQRRPTACRSLPHWHCPRRRKQPA